MGPRRTLQHAPAAAVLSIACGAMALWSAAGPAIADTAQTSPLDGRSDMRVSIRHAGDVDGGVVRGVEIQGEAASEDAASDYGFRSMRQVVDIDCGARRDRVAQMQVFPEHQLHGTGAVRRPPGQWAAPSPDAYLADVITMVCRTGAPRELQAPRLRASAPASVTAAPTTPLNLPPNLPTGASVLAEIAPLPPRPARAAAPTHKVIAVAAAKPPAPPHGREPAMAAPIAALALVTGPLAPPKPVQPAAAGHGWVAQVSAAASADDARHELDRLASLMGSGLAGRVEAATVHGRRVYRASVTGFASQGDAGAFCVKVERAGGDCWAR